MATWQELSEDNLEAAKELLQSGRIRSSISRTYYAAYCALTEKLIAKGMRFPNSWNNPAHEQVIQLIRNNLPMAESDRHRLAKAMNFLREARETADYRPGKTVLKTTAITAIYYARQVIEILEGVR